MQRLSSAQSKSDGAGFREVSAQCLLDNSFDTSGPAYFAPDRRYHAFNRPLINFLHYKFAPRWFSPAPNPDVADVEEETRFRSIFVVHTSLTGDEGDTRLVIPGDANASS